MADDRAQKNEPPLPTLALAAIGVVFGDIATSPLYALQQAFAGQGVTPVPQNVLGLLSLCLWSLAIVVTGKYVFFVMRADNRGEGGMMALAALARGAVHGRPRLRWWVIMAGLTGSALFFGDSVITPAISVLSAVEGLRLAAPEFEPWVLPIAAAILVGLFLLQRSGSARVGKLFGPVMALWLLALAALGLASVIRHPEVLVAVDPQYAASYLWRNGFDGFASLGSVVLVLTGAEALYADIGHFGKAPIRLAWFSLALPALLLNYFGQGALLLVQPSAAGNPFYLLVPQPLLYPMIALAACATAIASQAVISGAFSMVRQGIQLGYLPRARVWHTSRQMEGQIYLPTVNLLLFVAVMAAVLGFRSSQALGGAYGVAVSGTMLLTTVLILVVARLIWRWGALKLFAFGLAYLLIDGAFFAANLLKIVDGGWFPLAIAVVMMLVMTSWRRGTELLQQRLHENDVEPAEFIEFVQANPPLRVEGTAVFLTANRKWMPQALLNNLEHNQVLHRHNLIVRVEGLDTPRADWQERSETLDLGADFQSIVLRFGFAEYVDIPSRLASLRTQAGLDLDRVTYFLSHDDVVADDPDSTMRWRKKLFAFMARNAMPATTYYGIPTRQLIEIGAKVKI